MRGSTRQRSPRFAAAGLILSLLTVWGCGTKSPLPEPPVECPSPPTVLAGLCSDVSELAFNLPADVDRNPASLPPEQRQRLFDCLSWKTFIALNWPAQEGCRGVPDTFSSFADGAAATRVWETFKEVYEVFQSQNASWDPADQRWNDPQPPAACSEMAAGRKVLRMDTKARVVGRVPDDANEYEQAFAGGFGTLTDQTPNLVRYEVRFNRDEFEYIRDQGFAATRAYSYGGPKAVPASEVRFPDNRQGFQGHGAIEVKAAWRELTPNDDASRYYFQEVVIFDPSNSQQCREAAMGLVGFHIAHKTFWAPQWVWSTFEHVDNVPLPDEPPPPDGQYSFFGADCQPPAPKSCSSLVMPINTLEQRCCPNVQLNPRVFPFPKSPNQVTRIDPVGPMDLNRSFRSLLRETPFANYVLINTQWPDGGRDPKDDSRVRERACNPEGTFPIQPVTEDCYTLVPVHLRNTSMETYMTSYGTGTTQFSSDSCMNCHGAGGTDFSYLWLDAQLQPLPIASGGGDI